MDLFDLIHVAPEPAPGRNRREELVSGAVVFGLPFAYLLLGALSSELSKQPRLAVMWIPIALAGVGALVCAGARLGLGRTIVSVAGCLWWSLLAGAALVVIDVLIFPF